MGLTRTAPVLAAGDDVTASSHRTLLLALDELLAARYNSRSWLAFEASPDLEVGDPFLFGTASNLRSAAAAYDESEEFPPAPTGGQVVRYVNGAKVVFVTGFSAYLTLNRRRVDWQSPEESSPSVWWLGLDRPERFEALRVADVVVEDYADPIAETSEAFTWRSHWDRHGCIRVHNGNRHTLTLRFQSFPEQEVEIPPYGVVCGRRQGPGDAFVFESTYLPLTASDDVAKWEKHHAGSTAGSMEVAEAIVATFPAWARCSGFLPPDSTAREMGAFTGAAPQGSDRTSDWMIHRGVIQSVVLDKRDGTVEVTDLPWLGAGTETATAWAGHVRVEYDAGTDRVVLTSEAEAPDGAAADEWEHDLVPRSSNLLGNVVVALKAAPVELAFPPDLPFGAQRTWPALPVGYGRINQNSASLKSPVGVERYDYHTLGIDEFGVAQRWDTKLSESFPDTTQAPGLSATAEFFKSSDAICRKHTISSVQGDRSLSSVSLALLHKLDTSGEDFRWQSVSGVGLYSPRRFVAWAPRVFHHAGQVSGSSAVFRQHPQDVGVDGSADGLGLDLGWQVQPIATSAVQIESGPPSGEETELGRDVYPPADVLHIANQHLREPGWWMENRERMIAGTLDPNERLQSWRVKRTSEQFNELALAINSVREVYRVTIRDLHKDPLPLGDITAQYPFSQTDEPFAVPAGWIAGRYDSDGALQDWASTWGIALESGVPGLTALRAQGLRHWVARSTGLGTPITLAIESPQEHGQFLTESFATVNGETYSSWSAWTGVSQLHLFGGRGTDDGYRWLSWTEAQRVFAPLGVATPEVPGGERFDPTIEVDAGANIILGELGTSGSSSSQSVVVDTALTIFRNPSPSGSWIRVIEDSEDLRLIDQETGVPMRMDAYALHEIQRSDAANNYGTVSARGTTTAQPVLVENGVEIAPRLLTPRSPTAPATVLWPTASHYTNETGALIVASPEPWWSFAWDGDGALPLVHGAYTQQAPDPGGFRWREVTAEEMPITPAKLASWGWPAWACYHAQIIARTGVLRN